MEPYLKEMFDLVSKDTITYMYPWKIALIEYKKVCGQRSYEWVDEGIKIAEMFEKKGIIL